MDLKEKIFEILKKEKYSFKDLADYVGMTEEELTTALETKKLELRALELISKGLKIPLYSFFRANHNYANPDEQPYYVNKLWDENETNEEAELKEDIQLLREILAQKEQQLKKIK
jgi:transcriptional regulator with XRE-family HTH domain